MTFLIIFVYCDKEEDRDGVEDTDGEGDGDGDGERWRQREWDREIKKCTEKLKR